MNFEPSGHDPISDILMVSLNTLARSARLSKNAAPCKARRASALSQGNGNAVLPCPDLFINVPGSVFKLSIRALRSHHGYTCQSSKLKQWHKDRSRAAARTTCHAMLRHLSMLYLLAVNVPLPMAVPVTWSWFIKLRHPLPVAYDYGLWLLHLPCSYGLHVGYCSENQAYSPT